MPGNATPRERGSMPATIEQRVRKIIADHLLVDEEDIMPTSTFTGGLGGDSLDIVEIAMTIEEEFGIKIPAEDKKNFVTVQDAVNYVTTHKE